MNWETVIGLEVHAELSTKTKIFCGCSAEFGGEPNTRVCEICSGMPGVLPRLNKSAVEFAVKAGLALNCDITRLTQFDRKNYFYPDLPKAYQISQLYLPLCRNGYIEIYSDGGKKRIGIHEIHMEEDAGKLIHSENGGTLVDYNRCGVPLIEIVTEPDFRSSGEVIDFLEKLKLILQYLGVSDCKMQEGSMRADVNLSVRALGETELGTRTEMKNLSSLRAIEKAIEFEADRQSALLENGQRIVQETRRWDEKLNKNYSMRSKEEAADYKYFPEPDLPPVEIDDAYIEGVKNNLPELPEQKKMRYISQLGLPEYDTAVLTGDVSLMSFFERANGLCTDAKELSNWILGEVLRLMRENALQSEEIPLSPESLVSIINMVKSGKINRNIGTTVLEKVFTEGVEPEDYVEKNSLGLLSDVSAVTAAAEKVIAENSKAVAQYKDGKANAFQFLVGQTMKSLGGKAPVQQVKDALSNLLK